MKVANGKASVEAVEFKRYIGVCPVTIIAVNPTKEEHEKIFNTSLEEAPIYIQDKEDRDGKVYKNVRISVVCKPCTGNQEIDKNIITIPFFITNQYNKGAGSGKYQIVDKYGRFAWATEDEIKNKKVPMYANNNLADIDSEYRIAFVGEEALTNFIKTFLCIDDITVWDNVTKKRVPNTKVKPEECECCLDVEDIQAFIKGDFTSIKNILGYQPTNKVKICLGVRVDSNTGRLYQTVYTKRFMRNSSTNYSALDKDIKADIAYAQTNNKALNTTYFAGPIKEFELQATSFTPTNVEMPTVETVETEEPENTDNNPFGLPF